MRLRSGCSAITVRSLDEGSDRVNGVYAELDDGQFVFVDMLDFGPFDTGLDQWVDVYRALVRHGVIVVG